MTKLRKFQKLGVKKIIRFNGRVLLADEMGLGKTIQVLYYLKQNPETLPAIVVCPSVAKWVWKAQAKEHIKMRVRIINGQKAKKLKTKRQLIVINYEILDYWVKFLRKLKPQTIVLDECHYIKSRNKKGRTTKLYAKRTKATQKLCKKIPYFLPLSGTPLTNRPKELYNVLKLIDPIRWKYYVDYAMEFCDRKYTPWGWDDTGSSNLKKLHIILKRTCMIRRLKKDVLKDLPEKIRTIIPLNIQHKQEYIKAETNFMAWLQKKSPAKAKRAKKAKGLVKIGYLLRLAAQLKMKYVISWIDDFLEETNEKLVVFGIHKAIVRGLYEHYSKMSVVIDGSVPQTKYKHAVNKFNDNKKTRLFFGNIVAAGTVISLRASYLAFAELDRVPGNHTQAEDRIHGIARGLSKGAFIYYLIAKGTIEQDQCKIIQKKAKNISSVLDGGEEQTELNIYNKLMKAITKRNLI